MCERNPGEITSVGDPAAAAAAADATNWVLNAQIGMSATSGSAATYFCAQLMLEGGTLGQPALGVTCSVGHSSVPSQDTTCR